MKLLIMIGLVVLGLAMVRSSCADDLPHVGQMAVNFSLVDQSGTMQELSHYHGRWLVLYFYPKDGTPACTAEACQYRDDVVKVHALGAEVMGVSIDDADSHAIFAKKHHLPFPLLADKNGTVAAAYGSMTNLLFFKLAKRNTFIIDPTGKIAKVYVAVDANTNPAQVVMDLTAMIAHRQ